MGSDESRFNVSLIVRDKITRQCPETRIFEEKGEPKRIRTEVPLLTILTPYRWAKPAHRLCVISNWTSNIRVNRTASYRHKQDLSESDPAPMLRECVAMVHVTLRP